MAKALILMLMTKLCLAVAIYGKDDRKDWYEVDDNKLKSLALSTAVQVSARDMVFSKNGDYRLHKLTHSNKHFLCDGVRFEKQLAVGNCSAFLVGKDKVLTAGHCIKDKRDCRSQRWIFDYKMKDESDNLLRGKARNVFGCKRILKKKIKYNVLGKIDYALIKLDREVKGREIFTLAKGKPSVGDDIVMAGYPFGLPLKITNNGKVLKKRAKHFFSNLDAFAGNSGSPVMNANTLEVIGILTYGEEDFQKSYERIIYTNANNKPAVMTRRCLSLMQMKQNPDAKGEGIVYAKQLKL